MGRVNVIRFHPDYNGTSNKTLYAGSYLGGAWKTSDGGQSWTNMNTDSLPVMAVLDIAVRPDAPDTIYLATGDPKRNDILFGFHFYSSKISQFSNSVIQ